MQKADKPRNYYETPWLIPSIGSLDMYRQELVNSCDWRVQKYGYLYVCGDVIEDIYEIDPFYDEIKLCISPKYVRNSTKEKVDYENIYPELCRDMVRKNFKHGDTAWWWIDKRTFDKPVYDGMMGSKRNERGFVR